jgi:hypothetical protein
MYRKQIVTIKRKSSQDIKQKVTQNYSKTSKVILHKELAMQLNHNRFDGKGNRTHVGNEPPAMSYLD